MKILLLGVEGQQGWHKAGNEHEFAFVDVFSETESVANIKWFIDSRCKVYSNADEAIEDFKPDFAAINVPNFVKNDPDLELKFIEKKIPLLIAKLRLRNKSDFDKTLAAANKYGGEVYVGEFYRYSPGIETLKKFIADGFVGKPEQVRWECGLAHPDVWDWELNYENLVIDDLGFHHFSILHYLIDLTNPKLVFGLSASPEKGKPSTGSSGTVVVTNASGCNVSYCVDWHNTMRSSIDNFGCVSIDGTEGGVSLDNGKVFSMKWGSEKKEEQLIEIDAENAPEKILLGKKQDVWTIQEFAPVVECVQKALSK